MTTPASSASATPSAAQQHLRITDTTLRDGSHAMAHQFTEEQVRTTVHALDAAGVEVIEVTHGDGLGGSSFNYGFSRVDEIALIAAGVQEATQAKIAVLLVPVYSSFLLHAERAAERYGVPAHEILQRAGEHGYVGGQEDMIIDIAVRLAQERDLAAAGAR